MGSSPRNRGTLGVIYHSGCQKDTFKVPLACPEDSVGEEGFREIDITLIIKVSIPRVWTF